jgi:hypothetical protein
MSVLILGILFTVGIIGLYLLIWIWNDWTFWVAATVVAFCLVPVGGFLPLLILVLAFWLYTEFKKAGLS